MPLLVGILLVFPLGAAALYSALMMSRNARLAIEKRVSLATKLSRQPGPAPAPGAKTAAAERSAEKLRRIFTLGLAQTWGMRASAFTVILIACLSGSAVWMIATFALHLATLTAVAVAAAGFLFAPRFILLRQQTKTETQFMTLFPDSVDMMVRMLRAGLPITAAIRTIGTEAPPPVSGIFKALSDQTEIGIPFEDALGETGQRINLPDFRFFATAVTLQRSTGGNLAVTLEILSEIIRKRRAMRLKAQATTAEVRVSAYILGALPFLVIGALSLIQPQYLTPLFSDPRGKILILLAGGLLTAGFVIMRQMMRSATRV